MRVDPVRVPSDPELQWGRSTRAPENDCWQRNTAVRIGASMGPEHEGSGKYPIA